MSSTITAETWGNLGVEFRQKRKISAGSYFHFVHRSREMALLSAIG